MASVSTRRAGAWLVGLVLQLGLSMAPQDALAQMPSPSKKVDKAESLMVQAIVQRQLDAFARDDAAAAFALASSAIRMQFRTAENFLNVVKARYQPVYRHRVAFFTGTQRIDGLIVQSVRLTDADDRVWVALYRLKQEGDGQWRILGCELVETKSVSA